MRSVRLGQVLEVQSGFAFKTEFFSDSGGIPLIRIRDLPNRSTETNYRGDFRQDFLVEKGDYLIGMDGNFRCYPWQGPQALLNQRVCRLRNFSKEVNPAYIYYGIQKKLRDIEDNTSFATVKHISAKQILNIELPLPQYSDQRRLVDILTRAESVVRLRREALKKAQEIIPALFFEMFGDPATNQKRLEIASLESVAHIISGITKGRRLKEGEYTELPYMRVANVKDGYLDLSEIKTIAVRFNEVERFRVMPGDLLMTEGGDPDKLGRAAIWRGEVEICLHQNHIFKVRPDLKRVLPEYLRELIGSAYGKAYFLRVAKKTTGIATINRTQLGCFPVLLPPHEIQVKFRQRFEDIRSIQSQATRALATAEATFQSLLHRAFAGEL